MEEDDFSEPVSIPLVDGKQLMLTSGSLVIRDREGATVTSVEVSTITSVHRGGRDIVITCRETDPVSLTVATLADARWLVTTFQDVAEQRTPPPSKRRPRWRRRERSGK